MDRETGLSHDRVQTAVRNRMSRLFLAPIGVAQHLARTGLPQTAAVDLLPDGHPRWRQCGQYAPRR